MFDSDMDFLGNLSLFDLFFNNNTDWSWVDIENLSSSSMIKMVRHTFVNCSINNDVDIITQSILFKIVAHSDRTMSSESLREFMSSSWSLSMWSSHVYKKFNFSYFFYFWLNLDFLGKVKFMWLLLEFGVSIGFIMIKEFISCLF